MGRTSKMLTCMRCRTNHYLLTVCKVERSPGESTPVEALLCEPCIEKTRSKATVTKLTTKVASLMSEDFIVPVYA